MPNRNPEAPGDLVYLSDRKMINLAVYFDLKTGGLGPAIGLRGSAGLRAGIPGVSEASVQGSVRAEHADPGRRERDAASLLAEVVERLGGNYLPSLEAGERVCDAGWFRFHRLLRFGIGSADSDPTVKALIAVDPRPVQSGISLPGLLLNGSTSHVRPPYASDELRDAPGSRSGSGTDSLFVMLEQIRQELEADPNANLSEIEARLMEVRSSPRHPDTALSMYRLLAEHGWMNTSGLKGVMQHAPCEGVAQASYVAVAEETTLVMGSPLYIRIRALPETPADLAPVSMTRRRGFLRRLFRP